MTKAREKTFVRLYEGKDGDSLNSPDAFTICKKYSPSPSHHLSHASSHLHQQKPNSIHYEYIFMFMNGWTSKKMYFTWIQKTVIERSSKRMIPISTSICWSVSLDAIVIQGFKQLDAHAASMGLCVCLDVENAKERAVQHTMSKLVSYWCLTPSQPVRLWLSRGDR